LVSSWVISATLSLTHAYKYKLILPLEAFDYLYEKPWNRVGAYIIGMLTGGIFNHYRTPPKISRTLNLALWVVSLVLLFGLVFGFWIQEMPVIMTALVVSLGRTVWSYALVWVMLSCCWGLAPPINEILSWRAWIPLSRLTYCSYLIHPLLMAVFYHILDTPIPLHPITILTVYAGTLLLTFTTALLLSLLVEAPTIRVVRLLVQK
jgi:peptidoglycan/LPS O-acetylase OafA/YrhL